MERSKKNAIAAAIVAIALIASIVAACMTAMPSDESPLSSHTGAQELTQAAAPSEDGTVAEGYQPTGNPISDLSTVRNGAVTGTYYLTQDITVEPEYDSNWKVFAGTLDGNGHTITINSSNMSSSCTDVGGLFIGMNNATVKNLTIIVQGFSYSASADTVNAGMIAGYTNGNCTIDNVKVVLDYDSDTILHGTSDSSEVDTYVLPSSSRTNFTVNLGGMVGKVEAGTTTIQNSTVVNNAAGNYGFSAWAWIGEKNWPGNGNSWLNVGGFVGSVQANDRGTNGNLNLYSVKYDAADDAKISAAAESDSNRTNKARLGAFVGVHNSGDLKIDKLIFNAGGQFTNMFWRDSTTTSDSTEEGQYSGRGILIGYDVNKYLQNYISNRNNVYFRDAITGDNGTGLGNGTAHTSLLAGNNSWLSGFMAYPASIEDASFTDDGKIAFAVAKQSPTSGKIVSQINQNETVTNVSDADIAEQIGTNGVAWIVADIVNCGGDDVSMTLTNASSSNYSIQNYDKISSVDGTTYKGSKKYDGTMIKTPQLNIGGTAINAWTADSSTADVGTKNFTYNASALSGYAQAEYNGATYFVSGSTIYAPGNITVNGSEQQFILGNNFQYEITKANLTSVTATVESGTWYEGDLLSDIDLTLDSVAPSGITGTFAWNEGQTLTVGSNSYNWTFTPNGGNYNTYSGYSTIEVVAKAVTDIEIGGSYKMEYTAYDAFDPSGMTVTAIYNNDDRETLQQVAGGYSVEITNRIDTDKLGVNSIVTIKFGDVSKQLEITIKPMQITKPTANTGLTYNGSTQTGVNGGERYTLSENYAATNAGDYSATATLTDKVNTVWADTNNTEDITIEWSIAKAPIKSVTVEAEKGSWTTSDTLAEITLTAKATVPNGIEGTAAWDAPDTQLTEGAQSYAWTFTPTGTDATNYEPYKGSTSITASAKTLERIAVTTQPTKTDYVAFETFSTEGMVVTAYYNDDSSEAVTGYEIVYNDGNDSFRADDTSVTISYREQIATVTVSVGKANPTVNPVLTHGTIVITQSLESAGLGISSGDTEGTIAWVADQTLQEGTHNYNWTFTPTDGVNYNTATGVIEVTVVARAVESISIDGDYQTRYTAFDEFNTEGMVVTAYYNDDSSEAVTGYEIVYNAGNDSFRAGDTSVTISYQDCEATVDGLTVAKLQVEKPSANTNLTYDGSEQTGVNEGEHYSLTGNIATDAGTHTATATLTDKDNTEWSDGTTDPITIEWTIARASVTITATDSRSKTYDGEPVSPESLFTATGVGNDGELEITVTVTDNKTILNADTYTVTATLAASETNYTAQSVKITYTINKADPIVNVVVNSENEDLTESMTLADVSIALGDGSTPGSIAWTNPSQQLKQGLNGYAWTFTPTDTTNYNTATDTINVAVGMKLMGITISGEYKTEYVAYEDFDPTGMIVTANYSDGHDVVLKSGEYTIVNGADLQATTTSIEIQYNGMSATVAISVAKIVPTVSFKLNGEYVFVGTEVLNMPVNTSSDNVAGIFTWSIDGDAAIFGEARDYEVNWTFTPEDSVNCETVSGYITVTAREPKEITDMAVTRQPDKLVYQMHEDFDPTGLEVTVSFLDGTTETWGADMFEHNGYDLSADIERVSLTCTDVAGNNHVVYVDITVQAETIEIPTIVNDSFVYSGQAYAIEFSPHSTAFSVSGTLNAISAGTYTVTFSLNDPVNTTWSDGTTDDIVLQWTIEQMVVNRPLVTVTSLSYTGSEITLPIAESEYYTVSGNVATEVGSYTATITLASPGNMVWSNGSGNSITIAWRITSAEEEEETNPQFVQEAIGEFVENNGGSTGGSAGGAVTWDNADDFKQIVKDMNSLDDAQKAEISAEAMEQYQELLAQYNALIEQANNDITQAQELAKKAAGRTAAAAAASLGALALAIFVAKRRFV